MIKRLGALILMLVLALAVSACMGGEASPTPAAAEGEQAATATEASATMEPTTVSVQAEATVAETVTATEPAADARTEEAAAEPTIAAATQASAETSAAYATDLSGVRVRVEPVIEGLAAPVWLTHAGDGSGRLFILEKAGTIRVVRDGQLVGAPFLDIRDRVGSSSSEQGLLGLAFAPDYTGSGYFFVNYTDKRGDTVVSRFEVSAQADVADPASEFQVLGLDQPAPNHNGGGLLFGPDGYLWVGTGDGGAANDRFGNGQNPATLLGKMLRLDVTSDPAQPYLIPADNPWTTADWNGQDVLDEVWALGLRNPWRYSFDRATGDLWIADVGQNTYEEVHLVPAGSAGGLNFGWPIMEGLHCFSTQDCDQAGLELPVAEYRHGADGCSITGGYVYRGAAVPVLAGAYLFSDFCSGKIWGLAQDGDAWEQVELADTDLAVSSFGEDEAGELYVTDLGGGGVYRVVVE
jgi:glucose/arabinose dehydrogenase